MSKLTKRKKAEKEYKKKLMIEINKSIKPLEEIITSRDKNFEFQRKTKRNKRKRKRVIHFEMVNSFLETGIEEYHFNYLTSDIHDYINELFKVLRTGRNRYKLEIQPVVRYFSPNVGEFVDIYLNLSNVYTINSQYDINENFRDNLTSEIITRIEEFEGAGSGLIFEFLNLTYVRVYEINDLAGNSYINLGFISKIYY